MVAAGDISVIAIPLTENRITLDSFVLFKNSPFLEGFQYVYHNYIDSDDVLFSKKSS